VKVCFCPQYETLKIEHLLEKVFQHQHARVYYPSDRDLAKLPRQFVINVAYSVIGQEF
jgi:hypothetical protein